MSRDIEEMQRDSHRHYVALEEAKRETEAIRAQVTALMHEVQRLSGDIKRTHQLARQDTEG